MLYYALALALGIAGAAPALWRLLSRREGLPELAGFRRFTGLKAAEEPAASRGLGFVGRQAELETLFDTARSLQDSAALVLVSGPSGTGKRRLLEEFVRRAAKELPNVRTGPLVNLAPRRELDEVLSEIATAFEYQGTSRFERFRRSLDKYRGKRAGYETATERRLGRAAEVAMGLVQAAPLGELAGAVAKPVLQEGKDVLADRLVGAGDLRSVVRAFAEDLAGACRRRPDMTAPALVPVLLLENLDARSSDEDVRLLLTELLPNVQAAPVLILATLRGSVADAAERLGPMPGRLVSVTLRHFTEAETLEFARDQLHIPGTELAQEIWRATEGSPHRLAILHGYFQRNRDERTRSKLSEAAERLVATGEATDLVATVESEYQQDLLRALSTLRSVNAELLQELAAALEIKPVSGDPPPVTMLTRPGRGPRWFSRGSHGWSFDRPAWRESILREFRDATPDRCRQAHLVAALYHRRALARRETAAAPEPGPDRTMPWLLAYTSEVPINRRFTDEDYVDHLTEWLYHTIAIEPERGFEQLQDQIAEALLAGEYRVVSKLTHLGRESPITSPQRARLRLLDEVAASYAEERHEQAAAGLRQLDRLGGATPLLRGCESWHLGISECNLGRIAEAIVCFELARTRLDRLENPGTREVLMSCYNATWLAMNIADPDQETGHAVAILQDKIDMLQKLPTDQRSAPILRAMQAELLRSRALVQESLGDLAAAEHSYDEALKVLDQVDEARDRAFVKTSLGIFYGKTERMPEAHRNLDEAETTYRLLGQDDEVARVRIEKLRLRLHQKMWEEAGKDLDAIPLQQSSAAINARIGEAYAEHERWNEAAAAFERAASLQPDSATYGLRLADSRARLRDWEPALAAVARAATSVSSQPIDIEVWLNGAVEQDEPSQLLDAVAAAIRTFPERRRLRLIHALVRWRLEERESADQEFRDLGDLPDDTPVEEYSRRYALDHLDQHERVGLLRSLVGVFDARPELHFQLFEQLWQSAAPVVAEDDTMEPAAEARVRSDRYASAHDTRERNALRHEARLHLESACRLASGALDWKLRLVEVLIEMRDWEGAERLAAGVVEERPWDARALQLQNRARFRRSWDRVGVWEPALPIVVEVANNLEGWVGETRLGRRFIREMLPELRNELVARLGFRIPGVRVRADVGIPPGVFVVSIHDVPRFVASVDGDYLTDHLADELPPGLAGRPAVLPWAPLRAGLWLDSAQIAHARLAGLRLWDPRGIILSCLANVLEAHAAELLDVEQVGMLLDELEDRPDLPVEQLTAVLRALLRERVPIGDLPAIMGVLRKSDPTVSVVELVEQVRDGLAPAMVHGRS